MTSPRNAGTVSAAPSQPLYRYHFANNEKRATMKGRICRVIARGTMNSAEIEFLDNGQREIVSRNALRKAEVGQ